MIDPRIGKQGEYPPQQTISGHPAVKPFWTVHQLGDGYYVVIDTFPSVDVTEELEALRKAVGGGVKRTPAKTSHES